MKKYEEMKEECPYYQFSDDQHPQSKERMNQEENLRVKEALEMDERSPERNYGSFINHPCASEELHLKPHIGKKEEAPEWLVDNQFIFHGYRIGFYRVKDVLKSLFMWHNETTNIWSHLAGVILFIFLILYIVFCVGGMEFTRPLDTIIDKYDSVNFKISKLENDITQSPVHSETRQQLFSNTSAQEFFNISIKLWINEVELANPYYFKSIQQDSEQSTEEEREASQVHQTKASLEAQLYDTSLDYLLLLIQKFTLENRTNEQNREDLYKIFKSIQPVLIGRIDSMIEYHNKNGFGKKASHLVNLERNVNYHFNSDIVRTLIITGNLKENYSKVHEVTRIPMYIHMIAAIICLSLSSLFHLFTC